MGFFENFYARDYKIMLIIPAVLFIILLFIAFVSPGLKQGLDLKGGSLLMVQADKEMKSEIIKPILQEKFSLDDLTVASISSPVGNGLIVQFAKNHLLFEAEQKLKNASALLATSSVTADSITGDSVEMSSADLSTENAVQVSVLCNEMLSMISVYYKPLDAAPTDAMELFSFSQDALDKAKEAFHGQLKETIIQTFSLNKDAAFQAKEVAPTIGEVFWNNAIFVSIIAAILVTLVIFFFFRMLIPTFAIIAAAIFDIASALAGMALFGIPLSLATIPALLMLIGYSVDTDVLLTTRLTQAKELGSLRNKAASSMKTGLTMTGTTLSAFAVMLVFASMTQMFVIMDIATVVLCGLVGDLVSTWLMNAGILLWFFERKERKEKEKRQNN